MEKTQVHSVRKIFKFMAAWSYEGTVQFTLGSFARSMLVHSKTYDYMSMELLDKRAIIASYSRHFIHEFLTSGSTRDPSDRYKSRI